MTQKASVCLSVVYGSLHEQIVENCLCLWYLSSPFPAQSQTHVSTDTFGLVSFYPVVGLITKYTVLFFFSTYPIGDCYCLSLCPVLLCLALHPWVTADEHMLSFNRHMCRLDVSLKEKLF